MLLVIEAIKQYRLIRASHEFKYGVAYTYIIGAAFWNFVGAGVFGGGTLNAPLVNYYEHGTFLTLNHAHTALFGAFGFQAIGVAKQRPIEELAEYGIGSPFRGYAGATEGVD